MEDREEGTLEDGPHDEDGGWEDYEGSGTGVVSRTEGVKKTKGKKRKTVLFSKTLVKEADWDTIDINRLARDRKVWKSMVTRRIEHLERWER